MKADWILPDDMKLEVTLKTLINTEYLNVSYRYVMPKDSTVNIYISIRNSLA